MEHFLSQSLLSLFMKVKVKLKASQSCPTLCDQMDYTVHGLLQARILEWVALSLLRGIFLTQEFNQGLLHCRRILYRLSPREAPNSSYVIFNTVSHGDHYNIVSW